ncbi:TraB/GumN family protein [Tenuibacillus multivorans]|uniref:TraB family protein n=1 Tax=Tenuibacillus multivorans TaxID=237069 RepID=A0A1G9WCC8_9BACI|nr:TraB/GumN family protein [Tenuibacillus multivorans]GEL76392.1 conjugative transfer protein GumN [Tenuibacillus multivorans]SDM81957.1 hypothetical protein SAMN05216498_0682 [Tenuibacillus multivorans]
MLKKNMLKSLAIFFLLMFLMACTSEEETPEETVPEDVEQEESVDEENSETEEEAEEEPVGREDGPGGFLWKVEDEDTTVYLQGTIHVAPRDLYPLHTKVEQAYEEADVVVPEIDMNNIDLGKAMELYTELGEYQDGTTIQDHISPELYSELEATLSNYNIDPNMVKTYKPWYLSNTIQQLMVQELGYTYGVDQYFLNKAGLDGKEIVALETMEEQLDVLANAATEEYQVEMLEEMLVSTETYQDDLDEMLDIYREGDVEGLLGTMVTESEEGDEDAEAYLTALNDERNYNMADQIMTFLEEEEKTYFVIVGALHLTLEPHIGSILEENGYEVEHVH